jgi:hypothetical protein
VQVLAAGFNRAAILARASSAPPALSGKWLSRERNSSCWLQSGGNLPQLMTLISALPALETH